MKHTSNCGKIKVVRFVSFDVFVREINTRIINTAAFPIVQNGCLRRSILLYYTTAYADERYGRDRTDRTRSVREVIRISLARSYDCRLRFHLKINTMF